MKKILIILFLIFGVNLYAQQLPFLLHEQTDIEVLGFEYYVTSDGKYYVTSDGKYLLVKKVLTGYNYEENSFFKYVAFTDVPPVESTGVQRNAYRHRDRYLLR